jgi:hypothetical protein
MQKKLQRKISFSTKNITNFWGKKLNKKKYCKTFRRKKFAKKFRRQK